MKIRLIELKIENFQGGNFILSADGANLDVYGENASGKTRQASAFSWLLFGKDSLGRADFDIKNINASGMAEHGIDHVVEGRFSIDSDAKHPDCEVVLKKVYREKWTRKRGSPTAEYTGNTTDHFVDDVPVQKKEYQERIKEMFGEESSFRLLTLPTAFPSLHWEDQRKIIMDVCGNVSDDEVIASNKELLVLNEILGERSIDEHRKVIAAQKTKINKELEMIPVRIAENKKMLPEITGLDAVKIEENIKRFSTLVSDKRLELQGVNTGGRIAELSKKLNIARADLNKANSVWHDQKMKEVNALNQKIEEIEAVNRKVSNRITELKGIINVRGRRKEDIETQLQALSEQRQDTENAGFKYDGTETCPACGQNLPSDKVLAAKTKAEANFNNEKALALKEVMAKIEGREAEKAEIGKEIQVFNDELKVLSDCNQVSNEELKAEKERLLTEVKTGVDNELYSMIRELEAEIEAEKQGVTHVRTGIEDEIKDLEMSLKITRAAGDKLRSSKSGYERIDELKKSEKILAAEYEKLEKDIYITEQFIRAKVNLLTDRINNNFEIARFKLFDVQVNGALNDCCEITVDGIGYNSGLNSAAKIQAGLDIISTLQRYYRRFPVVWIDNRETIINIPDMECQIINLIVSKEDKTLRVVKGV